MAPRWRWLVGLVPGLFLFLALWYAWHKDPHFYLRPETLYERAKEAEGRGELALAVLLAEKAWRRNPSLSDCGTFLGWLYLKQNRLAEAHDLLGEVWERDPRATAALKGLAEALNRLNRRPEALARLEQHLKANPADTDVLLFAAQLAAQREEDRDLAIQYFRQHYQLEKTAEVRRTLVDLLSASQRYREAIPLQEEEAVLNPDQPEALHRLALLHYWSRDYEEATKVYQRLLERAAENAAYHLEAAQAAEAAQNLEEAIKQRLWLYVHSQGKKEHALPLARLWSRKGNHGEAAAVLGSIMDQEPDPDTVRWYALELLLTGDFKKARQVYRQAWERGDTHQETIINLARLYAQERQFSRAAGMWDEARRRQLVHGELRWEAALTYSYAHRYQDAIHILEPVERENPKYPNLLRFLGQMHFYQKHWGLAAHYFERHLKNHPDDHAVRQMLAEALSFQPEAQAKALEAYKDLARRTGEAAPHLRYVALLLKAKRWQEAREALRDCPMPREAELLQEQARLLVWAGDLKGGLERYELLLRHQPGNREALLEKARLLLYLGRAPEAREILQVLHRGRKGGPEGVQEERALLVALIQAALALKDREEASHWALRLYALGLKDPNPRLRTWQEAWAATRKAPSPPDLTPEERTWVARTLCHLPDPEAVKLAVELALANLKQNRYHHPSLLLLSHLLPKVPTFEELSDIGSRIPGIRLESPEYVAALSFFNARLGRHGGKLDYLLHVLKEYHRHRWPDSPGELLALADLAMELGQRREAENYVRQAQKIWPHDPRLAHLLLQCQLAQKDWAKALATVGHNPLKAEQALEVARLYMLRAQYEGVKATAAQVSPEHPHYPELQLLKVQACRLQKSYQEGLETLESLRERLPQDQYLMEKARLLEAMGNRQALRYYSEIIRNSPDRRLALVAEARRARAAGNFGGAYQAFAKALEEAPQDVELLNELEDVRRRQRPQLASRAFAHPQGESQAEEHLRPWQFGRPDREVFGGLPRPAAIPVLQPETLWFRDSNHLYGWTVRATARFQLTRSIPAQIALEYRGFRQRSLSQEQGPAFTDLDKLYAQQTTQRAWWRTADLTLGVGPVHVHDRLKLSGELILRRYWKRVDREIIQRGAKWFDFPVPRHLLDQTRILKTTAQDNQDRLLGTFTLDFPLGLKTDGTLRFSRRDLFDVEPYLLPRMYQSVNNLGDVPLITLNQLELGLAHLFTPRLTWRGSLAGAVFSDDNSRLAVYQGLTWLPLQSSRMRLGLTPHFYWTKYSEEKPAYFSPKSYTALGVTLDFSRQVYRLPTLILQATLQGVCQHDDWAPAFHGLAALEMEPVKNFFIYPHVFYFREWVDNYRILVLGLSLRYVF